ncbi:MAG: tetratricopeptide repeat protein [Acidobacteriota bacterium]|nr:MAG: tetratricopeptide repeat protein [Acidobacteriota bacterium]
MADEASKPSPYLKPLIALIVAAAAFAAFSVSLTGEFVYDDTRQIVRNTLIQEPSLYWQAMTSDVWAFKGDGSVTSSNYWRPTFTAWSILNYQLFGLDPFGWRLLNLLLHSFVSVLVFLLLMRWGFSPASAFAAALIFAVHPVHTESVAWVAGTPDLLFSAFLLGGLWLARGTSFSANRFRFLAALGLYALALGSKEVAMLCFPLFGLAAVREERPATIKRAAVAAAPFFGLAAAFFVLRWIVLGAVDRNIPGSPSFGEAIMSVPAVLFFYLKQALLPIELAVNHGLRPVGSVTAVDFILPLVAVVLAAAALWLLRRYCPKPRLAFGLLLLPLIPPLNITAFPAEEIVHDRYLYLPLIGLLMFLIPPAREWIGKIFGGNSRPVFLTLAVIIAVLLGAGSFSYSKVWRSDIALWEHTVRVDPQSASNFMQYGAALEGRERFAEAASAYERSLGIAPTALGYLGSGRANIRLGKFEDAVRDLTEVTRLDNASVNAYTLYQSYEALAIALTSKGDADAAAAALEEAAGRLPVYRAALSANLAVVYYQQGKKEEALRVLESVRERARTELLPESKSAIFRLGALYAEMGRRDEAAAALNEYLELTASFADENTLADRKQAEAILRRLR